MRIENREEGQEERDKRERLGSRRDFISFSLLPPLFFLCSNRGRDSIFACDEVPKRGRVCLFGVGWN